MKKMLQNFVSILSVLFAILYIVCNLAGFHNVLQNTVHRAQSVTLPWLAYRIDVVEQCCQMV